MSEAALLARQENQKKAVVAIVQNRKDRAASYVAGRIGDEPLTKADRTYASRERNASAAFQAAEILARAAGDLCAMVEEGEVDERTLDIRRRMIACAHHNLVRYEDGE